MQSLHRRCAAGWDVDGELRDGIAGQFHGRFRIGSGRLFRAFVVQLVARENVRRAERRT